MTVTQMIPISRSRSKIYIDQEFAFVLYKGEIRLYQVNEGNELSEQAYREILEEVLPKRARLRAMHLLKSREYTENQLREKLKDGCYPESIVEDALAYVASYHYIDDLRYAVDFITAHEDNRSRRRIGQDLQKRGISQSTLEKAWTLWEERGGKQDEEAMIEMLLEKKHYDCETADMKEKQCLYGFLLRRGFSADAIQKALRSCHFAEI